MTNTNYGYFDDEHREYVITTPQTPFPWINYLGNEDFFGLISNTGGGYDFYKDAKFRRITRYRYNSVPMDSVGRYFYIKDGNTVWNPGWKPCKTPLDSYECRHGMNYTRITGAKNKVRASLLCFVPIGVKAEIQRLTLTNLSDETKSIKLFSYAEWCLWNAATDNENFQRNLSTGEVEIEQTADFTALYHKTEYKERRNHYAYYAVNQPVQGFDTDREAFVGLYNELSEPQAVLNGRSADSVAHGWSPVASHYIEMTLAPGETRDLVFILGYEENPEQEKFAAPDGEITSLSTRDFHIINKVRAYEVIRRFATIEAVEAAFAQLNALWDELLGKFQIQSPDERLNRMVNIWNQYQCMVTFCMSRSASFFESGIGRGMGFRDSNQDLIGFVHQIPSRARQRILDIAATQFPDGGCYHQYQPLTKRGNNDIGGGFNDDPMWLIFGTTAYIRETGDFSILDEPVPWENVSGTEVPLMEHLRISFNHVINNLGPHGLPLIGRADWNDCLNLNCFSSDPNESFQTTENRVIGSQAESLMIAGLFVYCGRQYAELCRTLHLDEEALRADEHVSAMCQSVEQYGWDGEWYLRADGAVFGHGFGGKGEGLGIRIALLQLHSGKVHCPGIDTRWGAGLEAAHGKAQLAQTVGKRQRRGKAIRSGIPKHFPHNGAPTEVGARGNHNCAAAVYSPRVGGHRADSPLIVHTDVHDLGLLDTQVLLPLKRIFHHLLIAPPIGLGAQRVNRRTLAEVQHPVLDAGFVGRFRHLAAEGVELPHQVSLSRAADGGIAGHVAHAVEIYREAHGIKSKARGGKGRLDAGVSRADDRHVACSRVISNQLQTPRFLLVDCVILSSRSHGVK